MIRPSITIRPEQPGDFDAIDEIVSAAFLAEFGTTTEAALVRTMRARGQLIPELTMVAEEHGVVVGHIAFSEVTLDGNTAHGLGLAPVAVAPSAQKSGVGTLLITTALSAAADQGWQFVVLLGHAGYYPKFGFAPAAALGITGDYGDHDGWMAQPLGNAALPTGHVRYCSSFFD